MINPYQNNFCSPQFNPYVQQAYRLPETIMQNPQKGLNGMFVSSSDKITVDCVPLDGTAAFFPKQDLSEIYVKNWNADGTIRTLTFKAISEANPNKISKNDSEPILGVSDAILGALDSKFRELNERIDKFEQEMSKSAVKNRSATKKESDAE